MDKRAGESGTLDTFDVVIIGAGGVGTATAYHMARAGRRVLLLEQFRIGHTRGSSHGGSRIIRHSHAEAEYASLAPAAFDLWRALEAESRVSLLKECGSLDFAPPGFPAFAARVETMAALGYPHDVLDQAALRTRFPQFRFPQNWAALYQPGAGILSASRAVATMAAQAVVHGAMLQEESRVLELIPQRDGVRVTVAGPHGTQTIAAGQVVLAAGPWNGEFFRRLGLSDLLPVPLRVTHQQVVYFAVQPEFVECYQPAACPVYICLPMPHFYGFPVWEQPGQIKIGLELNGEGVDPDRHPRQIEAKAVAELCDLVAQHLVGVVPQAVRAEACLYTHSPDQDFIVDRHPDHPQILFGAGFTGRGFKFTILTGKLLSDLAEAAVGDYSSPLWREIFSIKRFQTAQPLDSASAVLKL